MSRTKVNCSTYLHNLVKRFPSLKNDMQSLLEIIDCIYNTNIYNKASTTILCYLREALEHLILWLVAYIATCILMYFVVMRQKKSRDAGKIDNVLKAKRVLIIIAHPDDECMFFGPTILHLKEAQCQIYLVCLTMGDQDKFGKIRKYELYESCKILGIENSNITLHKNSLLPDSMITPWPEDLVADIVLNYVESLNIDTVITFDKHGVSRHLNHIAIYYGVAYLYLEKRMPSYCKAYTLESINTLRKYSLILDLPISYILSTHWSVLDWKERRVIQNAMSKHKSQMLWFRVLYIIFSRYLVINTLQEVSLNNIELDLIEES